MSAATVIRANSRSLPLADRSVDLVVTSPPYFALRSYQDGGEHYAGQIGDEPTPAAFVDSLLEVTRECMRVLKPSGSLWVNLGDKYAGSQPSSSRWHTASLDGGRGRLPELAESQAAVADTDWGTVRTKSLIGIPWRYAIRCIDELGLILRAEIIWSKPNGLPESVTDRVRRSHEQWFHMTLNPRYYSAVDEIREAYEGGSGGRQRAAARGTFDYADRGAEYGASVAARAVGGQNDGFYKSSPNPLGKLPGSVWEIATEPLKVPEHLGVDHFAAFPTEWPRRIIQGWSPAGVCTACGEGRRPVRGIDWDKVPHRMVEKRALTSDEQRRFAELFCEWQDSNGLTGREIAELFPSRTGGLTGCVANWRSGANVLTPEQLVTIAAAFGPLPTELNDLVLSTSAQPVALVEDGNGSLLTGRHNRKAKTMTLGEYATITGYACACPEPTAPTRPAVVLDPFGGTGTAALVAKALGRHGISVDMSADYCRLATWRINDPDQIAKAMRVDKPIKQVDGQMSMLELLDGEPA